MADRLASCFLLFVTFSHPGPPARTHVPAHRATSTRLIAMADSEVDMRYQLDLSHVEDLPINSLGRRVRTRLYFTSESHLHTLLNVLRCATGTGRGRSETGVVGGWLDGGQAGWLVVLQSFWAILSLSTSSCSGCLLVDAAGKDGAVDIASW